MSSDIGIFGLSPRANNLAVNLALKGLSVSVGNRSSDMIKECTKLAQKKEVEDNLSGMKDAGEFCKSLSTPRKVILMGKPGTSIEKNYAKVLPCLEEGDILVDASGEGFETCVRRSKEVEEKGIKYMTMCVLGTDREVLKGCGFLVSGDRSGYDELEVHLKKATCEVEYESAIAYVGSSVSASYAELMLSGAKTAIESSLSEAYGMLLAAGFTNEEVSKSVSGWNKDDLEGPLVEEMAVVLKKKDDESDEFVVDKVVDGERPMREADVFLREASDRHVGVAMVSAAVSHTFVGSRVEERAKISENVNGPAFDWQKLDRVQLVEDLRNAVGCSVVMAFSQAFSMLYAASTAYEWSVECAEVARVVAATSIARCPLVSTLKESLEKDASNALVGDEVCEVLQKKQMSWRRIATLSIIAGVSLPVITGALSSFDYSRREKLPQNLINAQRDFYASEQFERTDMPRGMSYHCRWTKDHN